MCTYPLFIQYTVVAEKELVKVKGYNEIDNALEEKARRITINVAYIEYQMGKRHYEKHDYCYCID